MLPFRVLAYDRDQFRWVPLCECRTEKDGLTQYLAARADRAAPQYIWHALAKVTFPRLDRRGNAPPPAVRVVITTAPHPERLAGLPEFVAAALAEVAPVRPVPPVPV